MGLKLNDGSTKLEKGFVIGFTLLFLLVAFVGFGDQSSSSSSGNGSGISIIHNKKEVEFYSGLPFLYDNRLLVPIQTVAIEFNTDFDYNVDTGEITITKPVSTGLNSALVCQIDNNNAWNNGEKVQLPIAPLIRDDIVYVPLRFVVEGFSGRMIWDDETKTAYITTK